MEVLICLGVVLLLLVLLGFGLMLFACLRPRKEEFWDAAVVKRHGYQRLQKQVDVGKEWFLNSEPQQLQMFSEDFKSLNGWLIPCENAKGTVLMFHGWRSSWKLDFSSVFSFYHDQGYNLLIVDQRGHGLSQGMFITFGVKESRDVVQWATYAAQLMGEEHPLFLTGISMGATSVLMAADEEIPANVRGIIADCGFSSAYDEFEYLCRRIGKKLPARFLLGLMDLFTKIFAGFGLKEKSTLTAMQFTRYPVLFIHGTKDYFVPCHMTQQAYDSCTGEKELVLVEGAGHGMSYLVEEERVSAAVKAFLKRNTPE